MHIYPLEDVYPACNQMKKNRTYTEFILSKNRNVRKLLTKLKEHSPESYCHSIRVAERMEVFLPHFPDSNEGFTDQEIITGALLHDIGKLAIPEEIINKPEKLIDQELAIIRTHPVQGLKFLMDCPLAVRNMCLLHHEKNDGSGYPYGYIGKILPLHCQLLSILDIMDAVTSKRCYRSTMASFEELEGFLLEMKDYGKLNEQMTDKILKLLRMEENTTREELF